MWLYHTSPAKNLESVKRNGLQSSSRPRNDCEPTDYHNEQCPDEELIYFDSKPFQWGSPKKGAAVHFRVNDDDLPSKLDGVRYDITEDRLRPGEFYLVGKDRVEIPPEYLQVYEPTTKRWRKVVKG